MPAIHDVLAEAIAAGGSTLRDFAAPDGELGYFSKSFAVYDREGQPCACGGTVKRIVQGGRSTFYCPQLPALTLTFEPLRRRGARRVGASLWAAPFFIELEEYNGEYAAGQEAHPPQREPRRRSTTRASAASGPSSRPSSRRSTSGKKAEAAEALKQVQPEMARGVARGVIHKNTAARKFSRLSKRVASLG